MIESDKLTSFCERAFELENKIYHLDSSTFGLEEFKKAFLGTNKLKSHPDNNPLPFEPEDIKIAENSIFIFKDRNNIDVGYFTALCFFKKNGHDIDAIHIRFLAGLSEEYRGEGFHYVPLFKHIFATLKKFNEKYPDQNPVVNITQFAMVSPGTPGAIANFSHILRRFIPGISELNYGDQEAINMAAMFGLRELLDQETGKADINMKVKVPTFHQNKNNNGASTYDSLNLKEGEGIAGRQELGKLKDLLHLEKPLESALRIFSDERSTNLRPRAKL